MIKKDEIEIRIRELSAKIKGIAATASEKLGYDKWPYEKKRKVMFVLLIFLFLLPFVLRGCFGPSKNNAPQARPVQTALAVKKDVPIYLDSFGKMVSIRDVDITSQVTGKILEVRFTQGEEVKAGDHLFLVDPAPYQAILDEAEARVAQDTALMRLKFDTLERNLRLFEKGLISKQEIEQYETDLDAAKATVDLDRASVDAARINLTHCDIVSPVDGLAGRRQVDSGNIVSANSSTVLVNIKVMDELYVDFTLAEKHLSSVRSAMSKGQLKVEITVLGADDVSVSARLDLVDNFVDDKTGAFTLRALADNKNRLLWPGQFVDIRLILGEEKDAVLVPYASAKIGKQGYYVFVVTDSGKADLKQVTTGSRQGEDIVIEQGISDGETVVISGQLGLSSGVSVIDMSKLAAGGKEKK